MLLLVLCSYDFSTADNYIGPKPERMQVQLMEMNQVGTKRVNNQTIVDTSMIDPQNQVILNQTLYTPSLTFVHLLPVS